MTHITSWWLPKNRACWRKESFWMWVIKAQSSAQCAACVFKRQLLNLFQFLRCRHQGCAACTHKLTVRSPASFIFLSLLLFCFILVLFLPSMGLMFPPSQWCLATNCQLKHTYKVFVSTLYTVIFLAWSLSRGNREDFFYMSFLVYKQNWRCAIIVSWLWILNYLESLLN